MPRASNKARILEAAESVVVEVGAAHLSLDLVAERAGVSKGGLLYHFPSKEALLTAMVEQMQAKIDTMRDLVIGDCGDSPWSPVLAQARLLLQIQPEDKQLMSALLAAMANQPDLLQPVRREYARRLKCLSKNPESFARMAVYWLASDGLCLSELLRISPLTRAQRKQVVDELIHMIETENANTTQALNAGV